VQVSHCFCFGCLRLRLLPSRVYRAVTAVGRSCRTGA
jgi:hypothetical protein